MKKQLVILLLLATSVCSYAQYDFAIGLRSGGTSGITLKSIRSDQVAVEGIIGIWNDGLSLTGLYERHPNAFDVNGFHWLLGLGGHATFYEGSFRGNNGPAWYKDYPDGIEDDALGLGIDGMAGLEFKFPAVPLAISMELKPFIEFTTRGDVWFSFDPGLGIKFAF